MTNCHPACRPVANLDFNVLHINIEKDGPNRHQAKLHVALQLPYTKEVIVNGPPRDSRLEAVKDGLELGRRFVVEGEAGCKTIALRLRKKKWNSKELQGVDEAQLSGFVLPGQQQQKLLQPVQQKLLPTGEGWVRHSEDMLVHPQSEVYFVQLGERAGQYLQRSSGGAESWEEVAPPHAPEEKPVAARAASASVLRGGRGKLDRAVLLNDIGKIARLALKIPLSFVDRPASAYALFQGCRSAEAAQWCAENFHRKLLPMLAAKIHEHSTEELLEIARRVLRDLDGELLQSAAHPYSGCCAMLVLLLGDRVVMAGIGHVRAVLLPDSAGPRGVPKQLLTCTGDLDSEAERARLRDAGGAVRDGLLQRQAGSDEDDVSRILGARHVFDVLRLDPAGSFDEKEARSLYRKLALRVHPDKQADGADAVACKQAFARLESAKASLEAMFGEDQESCRQLCLVLRGEVHARAGAAAVLCLPADSASSMSPEDIDKACKEAKEKFAKLCQAAPDCDKAAAVCDEAAETLKRACQPEALHRLEALAGEGVPTTRAMGVRDLRRPWPVVAMEPEAASWRVPPGSSSRLALLCGATAKLGDAHLLSSTTRHAKRPKASALRWCLDADGGGSESSSCICIGLGVAREEEAPPAKKLKGAAGSDAGERLRLRHILLRHPQLRQVDPMARREGSCKSAQEAEEAALNVLERLIKTQSLFPQICREVSDCQTADQPGALSGDLGWVSRGQQEPAVEEATFSLKANEFSDVVVSSRGVHVFQRLA